MGQQDFQRRLHLPPSPSLEQWQKESGTPDPDQAEALKRVQALSAANPGSPALLSVLNDIHRQILRGDAAAIKEALSYPRDAAYIAAQSAAQAAVPEDVPPPSTQPNVAGRNPFAARWLPGGYDARESYERGGPGSVITDAITPPPEEISPRAQELAKTAGILEQVALGTLLPAALYWGTKGLPARLASRIPGVGPFLRKLLRPPSREAYREGARAASVRSRDMFRALRDQDISTAQMLSKQIASAGTPAGLGAGATRLAESYETGDIPTGALGALEIALEGIGSRYGSRQLGRLGGNLLARLRTPEELAQAVKAADAAELPGGRGPEITPTRPPWESQGVMPGGGYGGVTPKAQASQPLTQTTTQVGRTPTQPLPSAATEGAPLRTGRLAELARQGEREIDELLAEAQPRKGAELELPDLPEPDPPLTEAQRAFVRARDPLRGHPVLVDENLHHSPKQRAQARRKKIERAQKLRAGGITEPDLDEALAAVGEGAPLNKVMDELVGGTPKTPTAAAQGAARVDPSTLTDEARELVSDVPPLPRLNRLANLNTPEGKQQFATFQDATSDLTPAQQENLWRAADAGDVPSLEKVRQYIDRYTTGVGQVPGPQQQLNVMRPPGEVARPVGQDALLTADAQVAARVPPIVDPKTGDLAKGATTVDAPPTSPDLQGKSPIANLDPSGGQPLPEQAEAAVEYLTKERGFTPDHISAFQRGVAVLRAKDGLGASKKVRDMYRNNIRFLREKMPTAEGYPQWLTRVLTDDVDGYLHAERRTEDQVMRTLQNIRVRPGTQRMVPGVEVYSRKKGVRPGQEGTMPSAFPPATETESPNFFASQFKQRFFKKTFKTVSRKVRGSDAVVEEGYHVFENPVAAHLVRMVYMSEQAKSSLAQLKYAFSEADKTTYHKRLDGIMQTLEDAVQHATNNIGRVAAVVVAPPSGSARLGIQMQSRNPRQMIKGKQGKPRTVRMMEAEAGAVPPLEHTRDLTAFYKEVDEYTRQVTKFAAEADRVASSDIALYAALDPTLIKRMGARGVGAAIGGYQGRYEGQQLAEREGYTGPAKGVATMAGMGLGIGTGMIAPGALKGVFRKGTNAWAKLRDGILFNTLSSPTSPIKALLGAHSGGYIEGLSRMTEGVILHGQALSSWSRGDKTAAVRFSQQGNEARSQGEAIVKDIAKLEKELFTDKDGLMRGMFKLDPNKEIDLMELGKYAVESSGAVDAAGNPLTGQALLDAAQAWIDVERMSNQLTGNWLGRAFRAADWPVVLTLTRHGVDFDEARRLALTGNFETEYGQKIYEFLRSNQAEAGFLDVAKTMAAPIVRVGVQGGEQAYRWGVAPLIRGAEALGAPRIGTKKFQASMDQIAPTNRGARTAARGLLAGGATAAGGYLGSHGDPRLITPGAAAAGPLMIPFLMGSGAGAAYSQGKNMLMGGLVESLENISPINEQMLDASDLAAVGRASSRFASPALFRAPWRAFRGEAFDTSAQGVDRAVRAGDIPAWMGSEGTGAIMRALGGGLEGFPGTVGLYPMRRPALNPLTGERQYPRHVTPLNALNLPAALGGEGLQGQPPPISMEGVGKRVRELLDAADSPISSPFRAAGDIAQNMLTKPFFPETRASRQAGAGRDEVAQLMATGGRERESLHGKQPIVGTRGSPGLPAPSQEVRDPEGRPLEGVTPQVRALAGYVRALPAREKYVALEQIRQTRPAFWKRLMADKQAARYVLQSLVAGGGWSALEEKLVPAAEKAGATQHSTLFP